VEGRLFEPGTTNSAVGSMGNNPSMNVKGSQNLAAPVLDALTVFVSDAIVVKCERARATIGAYFSRLKQRNSRRGIKLLHVQMLKCYHTIHTSKFMSRMCFCYS
jgi:hypothetical protein